MPKLSIEELDDLLDEEEAYNVTQIKRRREDRKRKKERDCQLRERRVIKQRD